MMQSFMYGLNCCLPSTADSIRLYFYCYCYYFYCCFVCYRHYNDVAADTTAIESTVMFKLFMCDHFVRKFIFVYIVQRHHVPLATDEYWWENHYELVHDEA